MSSKVDVLLPEVVAILFMASIMQFLQVML